MKKLGPVQERVLDAINRHGSWPSGWMWDTMGRTDKILSGLADRGLVARVEAGGGRNRYGRYRALGQ